MNELERKTGMTNTECHEWDNYYTENTFEPGPNLLKQGVQPGCARTTLLLSDFDQDVAEYVRAQAQTAHKSLARVMNDLIRERIAVAL
jgi:hypothetical protein